MKLSYLYPVIIALCLFTIVSLFFYFPLVWLVLVWYAPDHGFSGTDVPYYAGASLDSLYWGVNRWTSWQFWDAVLDILRIVPPFLAPLSMVTGFLYGNRGAFWAYQIVIGILMFIEFVNGVLRIIVGFFGCQYLAICHGFDGSATPNYAYIIYAVSTVFYFVLWSLYLCAINAAKHAYEDLPYGQASTMETGGGFAFYQEADTGLFVPGPIPAPVRTSTLSGSGRVVRPYGESRLKNMGRDPVPVRIVKPSPKFPFVSKKHRDYVV